MQAAQRRQVGRVLEVDREALLAAVDGVEDRRIAADLGVAEIEPAREVAAVGALDLDDPGAEVGKAQRAVGPGQELAHVDDDDARQRQGVGQSASALLLGLARESRRVLVLHRLQVLAIEHQFALALEHLVARADQAHLLVARAFIEVGADRVDRVADEDRLDEAELVVAVGEGVDAIGGDQPQPGREDERARRPAAGRRCPRARRTSGPGRRGGCRPPAR